MGPVFLFGIALAFLVLFTIGAWETFKILRRFSKSVWHLFIDVKTS